MSVEAAKGRYHSDKMRNRSTGDPVFDAEFICSDCCLVHKLIVYLHNINTLHVRTCTVYLYAIDFCDTHEY